MTPGQRDIAMRDGGRYICGCRRWRNGHPVYEPCPGHRDQDTAGRKAA